jgi:hypothetical protein
MTSNPAFTILPLPPAAVPGEPRLRICPGCAQLLEIGRDGPVECPVCHWRGETYVFNPLPVTVEAAQRALPQDAVCLHHPTKKAVAVCAGTGDYICALCAIDLNGQVYSASYLGGAGKDKVGKSFELYLERPDARIATLLKLSFVPVLNYVVLPMSLFWIPYCFYLYAKALRLRGTNPLYARVFGTVSVIVLPLLLSLFALGWVVAIFAIVWSVVRR